MEQLKERLARELLQDLHVQIVEHGDFSVPVQAIEVQYTPISRAPMDVLMKMVLLVIQKMSIKNPLQISELLHVEILFITDILQALMRERMLTQDTSYHLTEKGEQQLALGIFEQQLETTRDTLLYSTLHEAFVASSLEDIEANVYLPEPLEGISEVISIEDEVYCAQLTKSTAQLVTTIEQVSHQQVYDVPCLYFVLYNKEEDSYYARVWHVLDAQWDAQVEAKLNQQQRLIWREKYTTKEELNHG